MKRILMWTDVAVFFAVFILALLLRPHTIPWFGGLILAGVASPLWIAARRQLGQSFSLQAKPGRLVTHGFYARIRHPIYLFGTVAYFGAFLALQIWPILAIWAALAPIEILRVGREERVLKGAFGEAYERYRASTWF